MSCQVSRKQSWQNSRQGFQNCPIAMDLGRHKFSRKSCKAWWNHRCVNGSMLKIVWNNTIQKYLPNLNEKQNHISPNIKFQHVKSCWEDSLRMDHHFPSWPLYVYNINGDTQIAPLATQKHNMFFAGCPLLNIYSHHAKPLQKELYLKKKLLFRINPGLRI